MELRLIPPLSLFILLQFSRDCRFGFVIGLLSVLVKSEDSLKLLASCFYRSGDFYKSYYLLRSSDYYKDADLKFLLAQCCYQMKKWDSPSQKVFSQSLVFLNGFWFQIHRSRVVTYMQQCFQERWSMHRWHHQWVWVFRSFCFVFDRRH